MKATVRWREPGTAIVHAVTLRKIPQRLANELTAMEVRGSAITDCGREIPTGVHALSGERVNCVPCLSGHLPGVQPAAERFAVPRAALPAGSTR